MRLDGPAHANDVRPAARSPRNARRPYGRASASSVLTDLEGSGYSLRSGAVSSLWSASPVFTVPSGSISAAPHRPPTAGSVDAARHYEQLSGPEHHVPGR